MTRWLHGGNGSEQVLRSQLSVGDERIITFLDFVQALAVHDIRNQKKISLQKIREAIRLAEDKYHIEYPLARRHTTYLLGDDIYIQPEGCKDLVQVTGRQKHQMTMKKVVEIYLVDLTFGEDGLAVAYDAFKWHGIPIRMNPKHRFGEPMVTTCGYTAQSLWEAAKTEGSIEAAAEAYGVEPADVEAAFRYYDFLQGKTTA